MISYFNYISLIAVFSLPVMAQEIKLNEWTKEYVKEMVGAREDIQYSIYKKVGESDKIYLEFQNRKNKDVKVSFKIVNKGIDRGAPIQMVGFIKANGIWPHGYDRAVKCNHMEPDIEIKEIITGEVEEEQVIEIDSDGKQSEKYKYKFKSDLDILKDKNKNTK